MSQPEHQFRVVMRGYDPGDVDRKVAELEAKIASTGQGLEALRDRVKKVGANAASDSSSAPLVTFEHLGDRVGQILTLAEQEAKAIRDQAHAEAETHRKESEQAVQVIKDKADEYADQRRREADADAQRLLTDASRAAEGERDAAERDAAARRQEAEAIHELQRANAARAASEFEVKLAERRERTAAEFQEQQAATQAQLDVMVARVDEVRATADRQQEAADSEAQSIIEEAEKRAVVLVTEARTTADRVRLDCERELAAATQRRDSINAQLSNVRQMLQTLSGSATGFAVDALPETGIQEPSGAKPEGPSVVSEDQNPAESTEKT
jgi:cell division septum initiation protein DivIVA